MEMPDDAARRLVGPNADYYLTRWRPVETKGSSLGFLWAGFLFGPYWMLYRRMYRTCTYWLGAVALFGIGEALIIALLQLPQPPALLDRAINLAIGLTCGVFGTYWYYLETRRRYRRLSTGGAPSPAALEGAGGVSRTAVWIGIVVTLGLAILYVLITPGSQLG